MMRPNMQMMVGLGKKRPPSPSIPSFGGPKAPFMPKRAAVGDTADPAADPADPMEGSEPSGGEAGGISPEEVDYSANDNCGTCTNMGGDGNCTKYNFPVEETGHCEAGYESKDGNGGSSSDLSMSPPDTGTPGGSYGGQ